MLLSEKVKVSDRFQRSIRIDTDLGDESVINSFVCPPSSAEVLLSMARGRQQANEAAFTWTGPYGSGKSSLVVALGALLGKDARLRSRASRVIGEKNSREILRAFSVSGRKGWAFVPVVGHKANVSDALIQALKDYTGTKRKLSEETLLEAIKDIADQDECGLFIVIDEMGKFLEAASDGSCDVYLFQQLAELSARSKGKIVVLGILHQAFAEYASRLAREVRDEWSKIQGRFIDLPLNVAGEELIDLIGQAIKSTKKPEKTTKFAKITSEHISAWRPVHADSLATSLTQCWPLHPVAASLLGPISRRRFGQNQRSVFGFLNSAEPYGFQWFLKRTSSDESALYTPARIWDYLRANLEPSIMASSDGHKWSLAVDALSRAEAHGKDQKAFDVLKCIALMDLFQERSGLVPDNDLLEICVPEISTKDLENTLSELSRHSIIRYKKHKKAYSLYEGSDFDIDASLAEAHEQAPALDFNRIWQAAKFQPIVAKKHYHETGALRWFDVDLVPSEQAIKVAESYRPTDGAIGLVMIVLGEGNKSDQNNFEKICSETSAVNGQWPVFASLAENSWLIRSHAKELQALEWIRNHSPSLGGDSVAKREVETRLGEIKDKLEEHLAAVMSSAKWFIDGKSASTLSLKEVNSLVSEKADTLYSESPRINSELVNRLKPSGNSVMGLKSLLKAMAQHEGEERLGIMGYPAEGGLFETLLSSTKLYDKKTLSFKNPTAKNDPCRLFPMWQAADRLFKDNEHRAIAITELYSIWREKPYGVKEGLMPFFAMVYLMTRAHEYAVYWNKNYRPGIDELFIDYLTKTPQDISFRSMNFSAVGQKVLAGVTKTLNRLHPSLTKLSDESAPLEIARRLVSTVVELHPWVLRTRELSFNSIKLRELIKNASDPNKVLFDDLPKLFSEHEASLNKGNVQPIVSEIDRSLQESVECYPRLISSFKKQLVDELQIDAKGAFGFQEINMRAKNIMHASGDFKLDAFAARLSTYQGTEADIEGIASLAADKPSRDWIDLDVNRARLRIAELAQQFNHIEAYGRVHNRKEYRQAVAFMAGINGRPKTYVHEFTIKQPEQEKVQVIEQDLQSLLSKYKKSDNNLLLAALANVGARILEKDENFSKKKEARA